MSKSKKPATKQIALVSDKAYEKLLSDCRVIIAQVEKSMMQSYWQLGAMANKMRGDERAQYGDKTVENLADDLGFSRSQLYHSMKFNALCSESELSNALDNGLKWRHVLTLLAVKDEEQRKLLVERVGAEGLTSDQLRAEVKKAKPKAKGDRGRKKQFTFEAFFKRMSKLDTWLTDEFIEAFDADGKAAKKAELRKLEELHGRIGAVIERLR